MKISKFFQLKIVNFTVVKNRCVLHGRVFVKTWNKMARIKCADSLSDKLFITSIVLLLYNGKTSKY